MKKLFNTPLVIYILFLFIAIISVFSCINQEEKYNDYHFKQDKKIAKTTIDFYQIDSLNQSNRKAIDITNLLSKNTKDSKKLELMLNVKRDFQKIDLELKNLTEKNLIIIPKPIYPLNIDSDSLHRKKTFSYLLSLLKNQIKEQIILFSNIEKNTQNIDFKIFLIKSKKILQKDSIALQTTATF